MRDVSQTLDREVLEVGISPELLFVLQQISRQSTMLLQVSDQLRYLLLVLLVNSFVLLQMFQVQW